MRIDADSSVPIFQQIVDRLAGAIAAGVYAPGELVPSVRQLALKLLVNPNTVQRAYEHLEREGLLVSKRGSGMEVAANAPSLAADRSVQNVSASFKQGIETGLAAHLTRSAIEGIYRNAWNGHGDSTSEERR
ncbi:MAG: GntR family transcriptional regulator [Tepidisphaeraceae bacterium]